MLSSLADDVAGGALVSNAAQLQNLFEEKMLPSGSQEAEPTVWEHAEADSSSYAAVEPPSLPQNFFASRTTHEPSQVIPRFYLCQCMPATLLRHC